MSKRLARESADSVFTSSGRLSLGPADYGCDYEVVFNGVR